MAKEKTKNIGVPLKVADIKRLKKVGISNGRKIATEARFAILSHVEKEEQAHAGEEHTE